MPTLKLLELKIPPPIVALLCGAVMWGMARGGTELVAPSLFHIGAALLIAVIGGSFLLAGVISFRRAKTTVNPMQPATASALVSSGIYRYTRNPMYLGFLFILIAWAVYLFSVWVSIGPLAFVLYINRFQIEPEEQALSTLFGAAFSDYRTRVRRWL